MAIVNRDKDSSEQYQVVNFPAGAVATGSTREVWVAPFPCTISAIKAMAAGLSGAPQALVKINRFIVGTGVTAITVHAAQAIPAFSTSGLFGLSLPASGSTLLNMTANDVLEITTSGSNTAFGDLNLAVKVQKTQDILSFF